MMHVLIINRYIDEFSDYTKYIDHNQYVVSYIYAKDCGEFIKNSSTFKAVEVIDYVNNSQAVYNAAIAIHQDKKIDFVIAYSEFDLDLAGEIRASLNISGAKARETELFRDKVKMKQAIQGTGVLYPPFMEVSSRTEALEFIKNNKFPLIIKPRTGASSQGVIRLNNLCDLDQVKDFIGMQIECFIEGTILHVDGIIAKGKLPYCKVSRYINDCLQFTFGVPLGSVTIDDEKVYQLVSKLTLKILNALQIDNRAFHLELICFGGEYYFLEIGGRVGGGEIPFITQGVENVDLFQLWTDASLHLPIKQVPHKLTGFLMVPNPFQSGYSILNEANINHELMKFKKIIPHSKEKQYFSYENIPGRFHFSGNTTEEIENAILDIIDKVGHSIQAI